MLWNVCHRAQLLPWLWRFGLQGKFEIFTLDFVYAYLCVWGGFVL